MLELFWYLCSLLGIFIFYQYRLLLKSRWSNSDTSTRMATYINDIQQADQKNQEMAKEEGTEGMDPASEGASDSNVAPTDEQVIDRPVIFNRIRSPIIDLSNRFEEIYKRNRRKLRKQRSKLKVKKQSRANFFP